MRPIDIAQIILLVALAVSLIIYLRSRLDEKPSIDKEIICSIVIIGCLISLIVIGSMVINDPDYYSKNVGELPHVCVASSFNYLKNKYTNQYVGVANYYSINVNLTAVRQFITADIYEVNAYNQTTTCYLLDSQHGLTVNSLVLSPNRSLAICSIIFGVIIIIVYANYARSQEDVDRMILEL